MIVAGLQAAIIAGVGLFVGLAAAIAAIVFAQATSDRLQLIGTIYWSMVVLSPVGVWLGHDIRSYGPYKENGVRAYASLHSSLLTSGLGAVVGVTLGALLLLPFAPSFIPVLVAGENPATFGPDVRALLSAAQFWLIFITTVLTGLILGGASYRRMKDDQYN